MHDDINKKLASLTSEQSKALAAAMNAAYDRQPETEPTDDDNTDEDNYE